MVYKSTIAGMYGLKETILQIYNRAFEADGTHSFPSEKEALDWLVK